MLDSEAPNASHGGLFGFNGPQWLVIAAGWAGWGFDVFDALLFNFVAASCIPVLLQLAPGPHAQAVTLSWTAMITSLLLLSWAAGGVLFGWIGDRIGRRRALLLTIAIYACGTAACALVTNIWQLVLCRTLAGLGIGGEWGIGAALVAEGVPEKRRVQAGVIMQTASPLGVVLAGAVNHQIAGVWFAAQPQSAWRYVFLAGLLPVLVALGIRLLVRESAPWRTARTRTPASNPRELFTPAVRAATFSGFFVAVIAVLTWWAVSAFLPVLGRLLALEQATQAHIAGTAVAPYVTAWQARVSNAFNLGGLLGALAAIPLARRFGRRPMFMCYFLCAAFGLFVTFGAPLSPAGFLAMLCVAGAGVYGIFGGLTFYLPELFATRLRATGAGFCYNIGRVFAAAGPVLVGFVTSATGGSSAALMHVLCGMGLVPLAAALVAPFIIVETRDRTLPA
jgi:MFS family permease